MYSLVCLRRAVSFAALTGAVLATAIALTLSPIPGMHGARAASAQLSEGPGYLIPHATRISMVGGFRAPDGSLAYCLEWGQESPTLPTDPAHSSSLVTSYDDWGSAEVAKVNWLISSHGQTVQRDQAAAVAIAIWLRHPGSGENRFFAHHPHLVAAIPDAAVRAQIVARAVQLSSEMDAYRYVAPEPIGTLEVHPSVDDVMRGEIILAELPDGVTGTLRMSGAILEQTGRDTVTVTGSSRLAYQLAPSDADVGHATVQATLDLTVPGGTPGPAMRVWSSAPAMQDAAAAGPAQQEYRWALAGRAEHPLVFAPTLTTRVPSRVLADTEPLSDSFQLALAEGSAPWRQFADRSWLPITVVCRAYGPFASPQPETPEVPSDAPLATAPVRIQVAGGGGDPLASSIEFTYELMPEGGGYYTSVCGVDSADQDDPRSVQGLPAEYRFSDVFGLAEETQFSPLEIRFETTLSDSQVHPGAQLVDVIVGASAAGPWAEWEGERVRVPLVGTLYWSERRPDRSATPPQDALSVATFRAELTGPEHRTEALIQLPDRPGWYSVRWCTDPEAVLSDEGAPLVRSWCDDFGAPSETVQALAPATSTPTTSVTTAPGSLATTGSRSETSSVWALWATALISAGLFVTGARLVRRDRRRSPRP